MSKSLSVLLGGLVLALGLAVAPPPAAAETAAEIDAGADRTLERLYRESAEARDLGAKSAGILVFHNVTKGGFIIGGEYGQGVLRVGGVSRAYYDAASGSIGLQAGLSNRALIIMFMTQDALTEFTGSSGWEAGVNAEVAVLEVGATGTLDTTTAPAPVIAFNLGETGLFGGVNIDGTKISRLDR